MPADKDDYDDLVQRILHDILGSDRLRESSVFSERSYSDEPILRTGADLRREREAGKPHANDARQDARRQRDRHQEAGPAPAPPATSARAERARARQQARAARPERSARPSRADLATYLALLEQEDGQLDGQPNDLGWSGQRTGGPGDDTLWGWPQPAPRKREPLPPVLQELRALQRQKDESGATLRGAELFVRQARVAADYTDSYELPYGPQYRYYPSYQQLPNDELRAYFTWRAAWREHRARTMPFTYVRLVAAELVNGVGAEPGEGVLAELKRLDQDCLDPNTGDMTSSVHADLRTWIRDYVVYFGLDPKDAATEDERAYARAVATLRAAERDVLARKGLRGLEATDAPAKVPTDAEVWQAFGAISRYSVERSPFFRTHPEESARVGAAVFRRMAEHCARRRKTNFVDGVVGAEESWFYSPFLGLPFLEEGEHDDVTVRITACETISHRFGRWRIRRGFERVTRDKDLGHLLKAIDRQMRIDWDFGRKLKEQAVPKYVQRMIAEESAAERERQEEAERRRISIDLSQLGHIRAAAATTREALLVDEEREDAPGGASAAEVVPGAVAAPGYEGSPARGAATETGTAPGAKDAPVTGPDEAAAAPGAGAAPAPGPKSESATPSKGSQPSRQAASVGGKNPAGLTDLELAALGRILDGKGIDDLLGPGTPMASVLVDSINEKLFDEVGDAVVEFDDSDKPQMVEDYVDDVREILG